MWGREMLTDWGELGPTTIHGSAGKQPHSATLPSIVGPRDVDS